MFRLGHNFHLADLRFLASRTPLGMMRWTQPVFNGFIKEPAMVTRPSKRTTGGSAMQVTRIGMDIAKQIFDLHGVDRRGKVVLRRTVRRERLLELLAQLTPCTIGMKAGAGRTICNRDLA